MPLSLSGIHKKARLGALQKEYVQVENILYRCLLVVFYCVEDLAGRYLVLPLDILDDLVVKPWSYCGVISFSRRLYRGISHGDALMVNKVTFAPPLAAASSGAQASQIHREPVAQHPLFPHLFCRLVIGGVPGCCWSRAPPLALLLPARCAYTMASSLASAGSCTALLPVYNGNPHKAWANVRQTAGQMGVNGKEKTPAVRAMVWIRICAG
jgi:hypothetical protein